MITKQDLLDRRESIQEDLRCFLDDLDDDIIDGVCEIVVDNFDLLLDKMIGQSDEPTPN